MLNRKFIIKNTLARVIYPKIPIKISKEYPFSLHYVLTTKFNHWKYEREWRIITELTSTERTLEYLPESVKGIYIGHKIPDENISAYQLLLKIREINFPNVPIYIVYPHSTDLSLNFERVL